MRDVVKCPIHDQELNWQENSEGAKYAVCICDTNGMRNKWLGRVVVFVRNPVPPVVSEIQVDAPADADATVKFKRSK